MMRLLRQKSNLTKRRQHAPHHTSDGRVHHHQRQYRSENCGRTRRTREAWVRISGRQYCVPTGTVYENSGRKQSSRQRLLNTFTRRVENHKTQKQQGQYAERIEMSVNDWLDTYVANPIEMPEDFYHNVGTALAKYSLETDDE